MEKTLGRNQRNGGHSVASLVRRIARCLRHGWSLEGRGRRRCIHVHSRSMADSRRASW